MLPSMGLHGNARPRNAHSPSHVSRSVLFVTSTHTQYTYIYMYICISKNTRSHTHIHTPTYIKNAPSSHPPSLPPFPPLKYLARGAAAEVVAPDDDGVLRLGLARLHCVLIFRSCVWVIRHGWLVRAKCAWIRPRLSLSIYTLKSFVSLYTQYITPINQPFHTPHPPPIPNE